MSSKRFERPIHYEASEPSAKRAKKEKFQNSSRHVQDDVFMRSGYPSRSPRLTQLECLVQETINEPSTADTTPELMQAISALNHAFRSAHRRSMAIQDPSQQPTDCSPVIPSPPSIKIQKLEDAVFLHPACGKPDAMNYDRLEILGDAYIELMATKLVWTKFPAIASGRISQIREGLVKNETLAAFSEKYGFDRRASVPASFLDQPKRWLKTKGDIFEAYVAAIILSDPQGGYQIAEQWLISLWTPMLDELGIQKVKLHSKEELAKKIMGKGIKLEYVVERDVLEEKGTGTQTFFMGVYLTGWGWEKRHLGSGSGSSKAAAGDEAARNALANTSLISQISIAKQSIGQSK